MAGDRDAGELKIAKTGNADLPLKHGQTALLTVDVWEHAYYIDYRNLRPKYVETFLASLVDWDFVAANYAAERPLAIGAGHIRAAPSPAVARPLRQGLVSDSAPLVESTLVRTGIGVIRGGGAEGWVRVTNGEKMSVRTMLVLTLPTLGFSTAPVVGDHLPAGHPRPVYRLGHPYRLRHRWRGHLLRR